VEKIGFMSKMFTSDDLKAMANLRQAFNPLNNLSPDKMLPTAGGCGMEEKPKLQLQQKLPGRRAAM
jgi:glycolate oxidase